MKTILFRFSTSFSSDELSLILLSLKSFDIPGTASELVYLVLLVKDLSMPTWLLKTIQPFLSGVSTLDVLVATKCLQPRKTLRGWKTKKNPHSDGTV